MLSTELTALEAGITASDTIQVHFTNRSGTPVVFDITAAEGGTDNIANLAYGGYVRAVVTLMNYAYNVSTTAPADNSQITTVIGGGIDAQWNGSISSPNGSHTWNFTVDNTTGNLTISNGTNQFVLLSGDDAGVQTTSGGFGINTSLDN